MTQAPRPIKRSDNNRERQRSSTEFQSDNKDGFPILATILVIIPVVAAVLGLAYIRKKRRNEDGNDDHEESDMSYASTSSISRPTIMSLPVLPEMARTTLTAHPVAEEESPRATSSIRLSSSGTYDL